MIDWSVVKKELLDKEGIIRIKDTHQKGILLACCEECLDTARRLARPKIASTVKPLSILSDMACGKKISSYINGADKIYIFAVTIGRKLEEEASRLMESSDQLRGYLLDRIGSFAVENVAENFEEAVRAKCAARNKTLSDRFSPGYCGWPTKEQKKLNKMLGFKKAGIRLTSGLMMVPKKSVSGIMGAGPAGLFSKKRSQCSVCDKKDCSYRRGIKR